MRSRQENREQVTRLLVDLPRGDELSSFLIAKSRLPGPRANLELASDVALIAYELNDKTALLPLFRSWLNADIPDHPSAEYLPFSALHGLGGLYIGASPSDRKEIIELLREAANSARWRLREAVTLALQFVGERNPEEMMTILRGLSKTPTLLEERAVVATVAHPPILTTHPEIATEGLAMADQVFNRIQSTPASERKQESFKVLAKGMGFTVSVLVAAEPEAGFALMRRWATAGDADIDKILKENLKKDRLAKRYPTESTEVSSLLNGGAQ